MSSRRKRKGTASGSEQPKDLPLFALSWGGRKRDGATKTRAKKATDVLAAESVDMGAYFVHIGLDVEEPNIKGLPPKKKKKTG